MLDEMFQFGQQRGLFAFEVFGEHGQEFGNLPAAGIPGEEFLQAPAVLLEQRGNLDQA